MRDYRFVIDVIPKGTVSAVFFGPFDVAKKALESDGYRIISLEENAMLRIQEGKDSPVSRSSNWTRGGVLYVPKRGIYLTKNSPIVQNAEEATKADENHGKYYLTGEQVEAALTGSVEISENPIPTNRFDSEEVTVYAFGEFAKLYGEFLKDAGVEKMTIVLSTLGGLSGETEPWAEQVWLKCLDHRSELYGSIGVSLYYGSMPGAGALRGIKV